jgi:hypothetical protein
MNIITAERERRAGERRGRALRSAARAGSGSGGGGPGRARAAAVRLRAATVRSRAASGGGGEVEGVLDRAGRLTAATEELGERGERT